MSTGVSVVIPTWNGRHLLERFLPSVVEAAARYATSRSAAVEIVIVDDGSSDDTIPWLSDTARRAPISLQIVRNDTNLGFGEAVNRGVRRTAYPLVFLVNNDVEVDSDALFPLVDGFERPDSSRLFAVHCRVQDYRSGLEVGTGKVGSFARGFLRVHQSYIATGQAEAPLHSMFASGGSSMVSRTAFLELGGFDRLFAPFYLEDVELSYRAWKRGWSVSYEPRSVVRHQFSSTIEPAAGHMVARISQRNRLLLHWIHLHDRRYFATHLAWALFLLAAAPLTGRPAFVSGFFGALRRVGDVRARRRREQRLAQRTDREVLGVFAEMRTRADIRIYDDRRELT